MQLDNRVKMGLSVGMNVSWHEFETEDDLTNIRNGYSFLSSSGNKFTEMKSALLYAFTSNAAMKSLFTRGINGEVIL